jgi:hypothetical protein
MIANDYIQPFKLAAAISLFCVLPGFAVADSTSTDAARDLHHHQQRRHQDTLLVWAGDKAHKAPDFVAVVDFDPKSGTYGKVLRTVPLPAGTWQTPQLPTSPSAPWAAYNDDQGKLYGGAIGNEPHHVGVSADKKTFAAGGLLSILNGQNQTFFFDISNPRQPVFTSSEGSQSGESLEYASIADEFAPLANGNFLGTFMGSFSGNAPGRVLEYDNQHHLVGIWPDKQDSNLPAGFNPHGISINDEDNLLVTSDFICPIHTLFGHEHDGGNSDLFRGSVRYWDLATRQIKQTIPVGDGAAGTIAVQLIPEDSAHRSFASGVIDGKLYLIDPKANNGAGTATAVFDFNIAEGFQVSKATPPWPHLIRINKEGTRLFITLNYQGQHGKVALFDIHQPEHPKLLSVADLGEGSGPHFLELTDDEKRLVVTDYFLDENYGHDPATDTPVQNGIVSIEGDHKIHVLNIDDDKLVADSKFNLDFSKDITSIPGYAGQYPVDGRPHGFALLGSRKALDYSHHKDH